MKRDDCDRPKLFRCQVCHLEVKPRCGATRKSKCEPCSTDHRKSVAYIGRSGAMDSPTGFFFVTLTAPGADVLPWDRSQCTHAHDVACSGTLGCQVEAIPAAAWNAKAPQNWSWWMTYLRRELKRYGLGAEFFKVWETQERGMLHLHAMVRLDGVMSRRRFREMVQTCALQWGFGRQVDVQHADPGDAQAVARKAGYCASYCTKTADAPAAAFTIAPLVDRVDPETGEIVQHAVHVGYRPWSASRHWGDSMKSIRHRRTLWAQAKRPDGDEVPMGAGAPLDLNGDIYTPAEALARFFARPGVSTIPAV